MSKIYPEIYVAPLMNLGCKKIDGRVTYKPFEEKRIMFRIVQIGDGFYFALEISIGAIFPMGSFIETLNGKEGLFHNFSGCALCRNYISLPVERKSEFLGQIKKDDYLLGILSVSAEEVNSYLVNHRHSIGHKKKMKTLESLNTYFCDFSKIEEEIGKLKNADDSYISAIDLGEIKDLGYDLSSQDNLCHVIDRDQELEKLIESIIIKGKSVLLLGKPGSGKTTLVEDLARKIRTGESEWLKDKVIFSLSTNALITDTKYRGEFEKEMEKLINFARSNKGKIILFIDEVHTLYGLGRAEGSVISALDSLKPFISNRDITIIGATTPSAYKESLMKDEAFCRRFDVIRVGEPKHNTKIKILIAFLDDLAKQFGIPYEFLNMIELLEKILELTDVKHQVSAFNDVQIGNINLAKDIFESAFAHAKFMGKKAVLEDDVMEALTKNDRISSVVKKRILFQNAGALASEVCNKRSNIISLERLKRDE